MSMSEDFIALQAEINGRNEEDNRRINMAISVYVAEAETLYQVAQEDEESLRNAGLDWNKIELLPTLCGATRYAQSLWNADRFSSAEAQKEWDSRIDDVCDHQEFCLHAMEYAYRNIPHLLERVDAIKEGTGNPDLIQDLSDTAVLGKENQEPLLAINFDPANLDHSAVLADEMAELLAIKDSSDSKSERKVVRDKAYSWLKDIVDEIYACGQYVFWKDEDRRKKYCSAFRRDQNRRNYLASKARKSVEL